MTVEITVSSARGREGQFVAECGGTVLVKSSKMPFLAAARALLAERPDCGSEVLVMRHRGRHDIALRSTVGEAAKLAVIDGRSGRPCFASWRPFNKEQFNVR